MEQEALAGMVAEEAANDTREGRMIRVLSPQAERVVGHVNSVPFNRKGEGSMGDVLAPEGETLGPPVAQFFGRMTSGTYQRRRPAKAEGRSIKDRPRDHICSCRGCQSYSQQGEPAFMIGVVREAILTWRE